MHVLRLSARPKSPRLEQQTCHSVLHSSLFVVLLAVVWLLLQGIEVLEAQILPCRPLGRTPPSDSFPREACQEATLQYTQSTYERSRHARCMLMSSPSITATLNDLGAKGLDETLKTCCLRYSATMFIHKVYGGYPQWQPALGDIRRALRRECLSCEHLLEVCYMYAASPRHAHSHSNMLGAWRFETNISNATASLWPQQSRSYSETTSSPRAGRKEQEWTSCLMPLAGDRRCMMAYVLTTATDKMQQTEGNSRLLPTAYDTTAKGRGTSAQLQQADSNSSMHIPPAAYVTIATGQGTSGQIQQAGINSSIHIPPTAYVTIATGRGTYAQIQQAEISSNIHMPPTSCVTSATGWGTYAQSSTRTSRNILILTKCETQTNEFISDQTNNSSMDQPDSPPLLPMAPKTLLTHLLLFTTLALLSTLILLSLSDLYESCRYLYNPRYTVEHAKPRRRNATRKRNSSQRTGLESVKCARNSMKSLKQRLQDRHVMHYQLRLHMDMQHPHYLKRAIAKQVRRCIKRSNGYLEREAYRIYRYNTVRYIGPTPPAQAKTPQTANFKLHDSKAALTSCPVKAAPCSHFSATAHKNPCSLPHETQPQTAVTCQDGVIHPQTVPNAPFLKKQRLGKSACHHNTCCNPKCQGHCQNFRTLCPEGLNRPAARTTYEQLHGLAHHQVQLACCQQPKSAWVYCPTYLLSMPNLEDRLIPMWVNDLFNLLQDNAHAHLYLAMPAKDPPDLSVRPCRGWAWVPADYFLRCFHITSTKQALHEHRLYDRKLPQSARQWLRQPIPATAEKQSDHMEAGEAMSLHYVESKLCEYAVHRAVLDRQDAAATELLGEELQNESHGQADPRPRVYATIPREQDSLRTFQGTSTGASCEVLCLVPPPMPSMQGAGKTSKAPPTRGPKAPHKLKRRSKPEQGMRRIDAMLGAAVPGLAPGSTGNAPTKQNPLKTAAPQPHNIAAAPHITRNGLQHRPDPLAEPDSEDEDVIMIDQDMEGLSEPYHKPFSPNWGDADAQRHQVSPISHTQWVTPETVGLYCQEQDRGNCALHALNAMAGRAIITPDEAQALLRHPQVPRPAYSDRPDCNADGWFRWEAINKLLYYTTTIDLTLLVLRNPQNHPQHSVSTSSAKARILALAPQGCNAFIVPA